MDVIAAIKAQEPKKVPVTLVLTEDLANWSLEWPRSHGSNRSEFIRYLIREFREKQEDAQTV